MAVSKSMMISSLAKWATGDASYKYEIIEKYYNYIGSTPNYSIPWCACTWSAAAIEAQATDIVPISLSCGDLISKAKAMGIWVENDAYVPDPGDGIIYAWSSSGIGDEQTGHDHIGTVFSASSSEITVIEGNMGSGICGYRTIPVNWKFIRGFILPAYSDRDYNKPVPPIDYSDTTPNPGGGSTYGGGSGGSGGYGYSGGSKAYVGAMKFRGDHHTFGKKSEAVNNHLKAGIYSTWYDITLGGLHISSQGSNNIFVSLEYEKNGTQQANSFTLNLAYVPKPGRDPNIVEKALALSDKDISQGCEVEMQYGYTRGPSSPKYRGLATDYSVEIRDGMLYYTITGYSGVVINSLKKIQKEQMGDLDEDGNLIPGTGVRPTLYIGTILNDAKEEGLIPDYYTIEDDTGDYPDKEVVIEACADLNIFEYVNRILQSASYIEDTDETPPYERVWYTYYIDDSVDRHAIVLTAVDPKAKTREASTYTFNWMSQDNNLVLDFRPDFKGSLGLFANSAAEFLKKRKATVTDNGDVAYIYSYEDIKTDDYRSESKMYASQWMKAVQTPYSAKMTTVGVPCDAPIGEIVVINPLIYGVKHHTAGRYMILKTRDIIDGSGYMTTVELMKIGE